MTGLEHYREAERLLAEHTRFWENEPSSNAPVAERNEWENWRWRIEPILPHAQVHALLALVTVTGSFVEESE